MYFGIGFLFMLLSWGYISWRLLKASDFRPDPEDQLTNPVLFGIMGFVLSWSLLIIWPVVLGYFIWINRNNFKPTLQELIKK